MSTLIKESQASRNNIYSFYQDLHKEAVKKKGSNIDGQVVTSKRYDLFITKGSSHFQGFDLIPLLRETFKYFSSQKMCKSHISWTLFL